MANRSQIGYIFVLGRKLGLSTEDILEKASEIAGWTLTNEGQLEGLTQPQTSTLIDSLKEELGE